MKDFSKSNATTDFQSLAAADQEAGLVEDFLTAKNAINILIAAVEPNLFTMVLVEDGRHSDCSL